MFDEICLHVNELRRLNCLVLHNVLKKPRVVDEFGTARPVIIFHDSDSLAKKKLLCVQATKVAKKYYTDYLKKMEARMAKMSGIDLEPNNLEKNLDDSRRLNSMLKYNMEGIDFNEDE
jgi:hypothetical protein